MKEFLSEMSKSFAARLSIPTPGFLQAQRFRNAGTSDWGWWTQ
jgi:hypothetical protein